MWLLAECWPSAPEAPGPLLKNQIEPKLKERTTYQKPRGLLHIVNRQSQHSAANGKKTGSKPAASASSKDMRIVTGNGTPSEQDRGDGEGRGQGQQSREALEKAVTPKLTLWEDDKSDRSLTNKLERKGKTQINLGIRKAALPSEHVEVQYKREHCGPQI